MKNQEVLWLKSISYLKANAVSLFKEINKEQITFVITQNGEAKVIVQGIKIYQKTQETKDMLKLLAMKREKSKNAKRIQENFTEVSINKIS